MAEVVTVHDLYCPMRDVTEQHDYCCPSCEGFGCECDTIGVVREDMLERAAAVIYKHCSHTKIEGGKPCWHDQMVHELYEEAS